MKGFKFGSAIAMILLAVLSVFAGMVSAQATADNFVVTNVEINDQDATGVNTPAIRVERGELVPIEVTVVGQNEGTYDLRVRAYIGGYEYGTIQAESEIQELEAGTSDRFELNIQIPEDIEASDDYTLYVEVFDDDRSIRYDYALRIQEQRHAVTTYDVILNPHNNVKAGQPLFASVRVENLGDNVEESIKVTVSIPELGISASEYVDQLITEEDLDDDDRVVYAKKDSASTNDLMLLIPADAKEGDYQVRTVIEYNRGHSREESVQLIHVTSGKGVRPMTGDVVVNFDETTQSAALGKGAVYKVSVANLGEDQTFTVELTGTNGWATTRVDPQTQTIGSEKTADFNVYVSPNEGTQPGTRTFTAVVKDADGNVVSEKALTLNVNAEDDSNTLKRVLEVAFVVLLIILVIVGLVVLVKKLGGEEPEEPVEGKTYY